MASATNALFALVDCNNFYVSCERVFNPKLHGKPVVVLSNNDGCVVSRSNESKALGVKMGAPWFQLKDLGKKHGIIALSSNYALYGDMSRRVMTILRDYSPDMEVYSIDESFLSLNGLSGLWPCLGALGQHIRQRVLQWTGLPICVGIGPSKTLAKLASHIAKKRSDFDGVCDLTALSRREREQHFASIDVNDVWGIGRRISRRLVEAGIDNVQALRMTSPKWLRAEFGVVMERTGNELRGISCLDLEQVAAPKNQIICSRSFGQLVTTIGQLAEAATTYMSRAAARLRAQNSTAGAVHVFVMTNRFRETDPQYSDSVTLPLSEPSCDTRTLTNAALSGLERIFRKGYLYKKAGVMLMDIAPASIRQSRLFDSTPCSVRSAKLMAALDSLNEVYGRDTVFLGSAGVGSSWETRSDNRTLCYTTRWEEVPKIGT